MSRYRLSWYKLDPREPGNWYLNLQFSDVFAPIIDSAFPEVKHIGWRPASGKSKYTYFKRIPDGKEHDLRRFLEFLRSVLVLKINRHLEGHFSNELDECLALDFTFRDNHPGTHTGVGELLNRAKYKKEIVSVERLAELLMGAIKAHPRFARAECIAAIPGNPGKKFHLPDKLVDRIQKELMHRRVIGISKEKRTQQIKNAQIANKVDLLSDAFSLNTDIDGRTVLLIDDLYQSGTTLWSLAKFLKEKGAAQVYGLVCVKSWRDSDNQ